MSWITARYNSECKECEAEIEIGEVAYYENNKIYCETCGEEIQPKQSKFSQRINN